MLRTIEFGVIIGMMSFSGCPSQPKQLTTKSTPSRLTRPTQGVAQKRPAPFTVDAKAMKRLRIYNRYNTINEHTGRARVLIFLEPKVLTNDVVDWANLNGALIRWSCNKPIPRHLKRLHCVWGTVDAKIIKSLTHLEHFDAGGTSVDEAWLSVLGQKQTLVSLNLGGANLKDKHLKALQGLSRLRHLDLSSNIDLTGLGLVWLRHNTRLNVLNLSHTDLKSKYGKSITLFPKLVHLNVDGTDLQDRAITSWHKLEHLKVLKFEHSSLTMKSLNTLNKMKRLEIMEMGSWLRDNIKPKHMAPLSQMASLHVLDLSRIKMPGRGLKHLRRMKNLRQLNLSRLSIKDRDMQYIQHLNHLEELRVYKSVHLTGKILRYIKPLKQLKLLDVGGTQITNADLKTLASWKHITYLDLCNAKRLTAEDVRRHDFSHLTNKVHLQCGDGEDSECGDDDE